MSTLVLTVMFSFTSFAELESTAVSASGNTHYVDFEKLRKQDGYVYFWDLNDLAKPDKDGDLSYALYIQGDCKLFRFKVLTEVYYKQNMGRGTPTNNPKKNPQWTYPTPNSVSETVLEEVCGW